MNPYFSTERGQQFCGPALGVLKQLPVESVNCCITSPPYWALRDYGVEGQLGLEPTFQEYINKLCDIFDEVKRVLQEDGTCWVVLGDTYGGSWSNYGARNCHQRKKTHKRFKRPGAMPQNWKPPTINLPPKSLCQIPSRFSIEMCNRGWILRNEIIWHKPNAMPWSGTDRFTVDFEHVFFFVKKRKYLFKQQFEKIKLESIMRERRGNNENKYSKDEHFPVGVHANTMSKPRKYKGYEGIKEEIKNRSGRNKRCVWEIPTYSFSEAHFATFPEKLCITPIKAGCPENGTVLDPFSGSGTVAVVAEKLNRKWIGIDLSKEYCKIAKRRIEAESKQGKLC